jgi:hypothetical protein
VGEATRKAPRSGDASLPNEDWPTLTARKGERSKRLSESSSSQREYSCSRQAMIARVGEASSPYFFIRGDGRSVNEAKYQCFLISRSKTVSLRRARRISVPHFRTIGVSLLRLSKRKRRALNG